MHPYLLYVQMQISRAGLESAEQARRRPALVEFERQARERQAPQGRRLARRTLALVKRRASDGAVTARVA